MLALLLALLSAPPITIIVDAETNSRRLVSELEQDWFILGVDHNTVTWNSYQQDLRRVKIVDSTRPENIHYSRLRSYPVILYGDSLVELKLDEKSYKETSWALTSLWTLIHNHELDDARYNELCRLAREAHISNCISDMINWAYKNFPEEASEFINEYYGEWQEEDIKYDRLIEKFGERIGFPTPRPLILPKNPKLQMPYGEK
ncbi:MAG: hypothetical protein ACHQ1D_00475 [Nitrososphaerales archaeon]